MRAGEKGTEPVRLWASERAGERVRESASAYRTYMHVGMCAATIGWSPGGGDFVQSMRAREREREVF